MTALAYKQTDYVAPPQPQLRVLAMPEVTHMGEVYDTPLRNGMRPHPQARPSYDMFDVKGVGDDSGVYVVFMLKVGVEKKRSYFLTAARKLCTPPVKKQGGKPIYGCDEAGFNPAKNDTIDLRDKPAAYRHITRFIKTTFPNAKLNIA